MEARFGYDFGKVQIHDDALAHRSSQNINAHAYTHENHIVFAAGHYKPNTNDGKQLLAHELTHVLQQRDVSMNTVQKAPVKLPVEGGGSITYNPTGELSILGMGIEMRSFSNGQKDSISVSAGTSADVTIKVNIDFNGGVFNSWQQEIKATWPISVTKDGKLKIKTGSKTLLPVTGKAQPSVIVQDIELSQDDDFVEATPVIVGVSVTSGVSFAIGVSKTTPAQVVKIPFKLSIQVINSNEEIPVDITFGKVYVPYFYEIHFDTNKADISEDEYWGFVRWYNGLPRDVQQRIESGDVDINLTASASAPGKGTYNQDLSDKRMDTVSSFLIKRFGNAKIKKEMSLGETESKVPESKKFKKEQKKEQKVTISILAREIP